MVTMQNKQWYETQAKKHYRAYQAAVEVGDTQAMKFHEKEYLTYDKAAKSQGS